MLSTNDMRTHLSKHYQNKTILRIYKYCKYLEQSTHEISLVEMRICFQLILFICFIFLLKKTIKNLPFKYFTKIVTFFFIVL